MRWEQVRVKGQGRNKKQDVVMQLRRTARNAVRCPLQIFSALFLDNTSACTSYKQIAWEREGVTPSQGCGGVTPTSAIFPAQFLDKTGAWKKHPIKVRHLRECALAGAAMGRAGHPYILWVCVAFTFVVGRIIKSGRGGEESENAGFPRSERGFSGVKPRCEKFHKKTIFCGLASIDNNILL